MKINFLLLLLLPFTLLSNGTFAQSLSRSVIGGAGDYYEDATLGDFHFTLGEVAVEYLDEEESLAEGFHQLHRNLLSVAVDNPTFPDFQIVIYPNPTADFVYVETDNQTPLRLTVTDILGRQIQQISLTAGRHTFNLGDLPAGTYAFTVFAENILLHSEKIQVIR